MLLFSCSVVSNFLQPHGLQQTGFPCYSPAPRACSNSCPLIESVMPSNYRVLCCPRLLLPSILPSIRVFSNESVLTSGWQSIGASSSASVLPINIQDWFPLQLTGLISLQSKGLSWDSKFKCESEIEALFIGKS